MNTVLSTLTTPNGRQSLPVSVPTCATQRAIIRRVKSAHGIKAQHKAHEFTGPDGGTYIHIRLHGSAASILVEIDAMEVEE